MTRHEQTEGRRTRPARHRALAALVLAAVAGGCSINPSTGRSQFILVSPDQMSAMGSSAMPELVQSYGGEYPSGALHGYVAGVGHTLAGLTEADFPRLDWEFTVLNSDIINAFALPGGKVFISAGLLARLEDEAEMAGVLGHEVGHVTARHVDERISQAMAIELGVAAVSVATDSELASVAGSMFGQGYLLKFGRDQELEADRQGLKYMTQAGYAPAAMRDVMEVLKSATQGGNEPPEFLSTHPHPNTRIAAIDRALDTEYRSTVGNSSYRRFRGRFEQNALTIVQASPDGPVENAWCAVCRARSGEPRLAAADPGPSLP
ncbi:MAG: M48 family metalloprotease [Planctomycetota bacterium]